MKEIFLIVALALNTMIVSAWSASRYVPGQYPAIQAAINASNNGDEVIVANGTYVGTGNRDIDFLGKAITVRSENGPETCIIDCNGMDIEPHSAFYFQSGEDGNSVLDGLTITNAYQNAYTGAIDCTNESSPTIKNCNIKDNVSIGVYGSYGAIVNCNIINNNGEKTDPSQGESITIGGLYGCFGPITNCLIIGNGGGGMLCDSPVTNCTISQNKMQHRYQYGALVSSASFGIAPVINCIIWDNESPSVESSSNPQYSCIQDWTGAGVGNITTDPLFVAPGYWDDDIWVDGDYHLLADSPCIDAGDPNYCGEPNEFDIDGNVRVISRRIDMGADEYSYAKLCDLYKDGIVNFKDFSILAYYWMDNGCSALDWCKGADINHSGIVDFTDILIMAENWLVEYEEPNGMIWVYIDDEGVPGHEGFTGYMSKYETTNAQYCQFLNAALASGDIVVTPGDFVYGAIGSNNGADFEGEFYIPADSYSPITYSGSMFSVQSRDSNDMSNHPVVDVTWYGATAFCNYYGYQLPTEWQWQAVADFDGNFIYGCGTTINQTKANYYENGLANPLGLTSSPYTSPVNYYSSYGYGINDMAGNVWEWTSSSYDNPDYSYHIICGGSWADSSSNCTVSHRRHDPSDDADEDRGFRACR